MIAFFPDLIRKHLALPAVHVCAIKGDPQGPGHKESLWQARTRTGRQKEDQ